MVRHGGEQTEQGRCAVERGADGAAAPPSPARFGRGKVSSTLPGGGSGPSGDGSGPAWSRARGGGRVAVVAAAAVSLGVGPCLVASRKNFEKTSFYI